METLFDLIRLPPERIAAALVFLAGFMVACEYLRITLSVVAPRSVPVHVLCALLTVVIQPVVLAASLVLGIADHPQRALINMLYIALLYMVWYLAGQSTLLVRPDTQGADLGFMAVGALFITFPPGLVAALVY
ncbi:MAG: hypothetical protein MJE77_19530 [Proteobacteria bacterium]|nr:hypothetical protein [Pseudomonadota bacterium]